MAGDGGNTIGGCSSLDGVPVTAIPTLGEGAILALVALLAGMGLLVLRRLSF